jgi:hypothetical protein
VNAEVLVENVLNALTAGLTIGCIYGLMCIGLGLIFGIMRIVNFASSGRISARSWARSVLGRSYSPAARCCTSS